MKSATPVEMDGHILKYIYYCVMYVEFKINFTNYDVTTNIHICRYLRFTYL